MVNKVVMRGKITRPCELRYLPKDGAVCSTELSVSRYFKKEDGTRIKDICCIDIDVFGRSAEAAYQYLVVGKKILVEGYLKFNQWKDHQGIDRSRYSITVETLQL